VRAGRARSTRTGRVTPPGGSSAPSMHSSGDDPAPPGGPMSPAATPWQAAKGPRHRQVLHRPAHLGRGGRGRLCQCHGLRRHLGRDGGTRRRGQAEPGTSVKDRRRGEEDRRRPRGLPRGMTPSPREDRCPPPRPPGRRRPAPGIGKSCTVLRTSTEAVGAGWPAACLRAPRGGQGPSSA